MKMKKLSGPTVRVGDNIDTDTIIPARHLSSTDPKLLGAHCLELLDAIYARHGNAGRFDAIFADPPYFLSNGGITCHAGRMVKVDRLGAKKE